MRLFEEALLFAAERHSGQVRKSSPLPYILHPMEVAAIAATLTEDEEILAAAVLHDTVEDTNTTLEEIEARFGRRVALLVMTETEEKRPERPPAETWELRKEETLLILENTKDPGVRILWLSDKLSNMRSFARQYRVLGDALWQNFNQKDPECQARHYRRIARYLLPLAHTDAYKEYLSLVNEVFEHHNGGAI